jgi:DNA-binding transcriptional MerR regulator
VDGEWNIGELARRAEIGVDAIRYHERRGILPAPFRRPSGYRQYTAATVERIRFVKALQALGFNLDEVREVLRDVDEGIASCGSERPRFEVVLARIDRKLADLKVVRRGLIETLGPCRDGKCTFL